MMFNTNPEETSYGCKQSYDRYMELVTMRPREGRRADAATAKWRAKHKGAPATAWLEAGSKAT